MMDITKLNTCELTEAVCDSPQAVHDEVAKRIARIKPLYDEAKLQMLRIERELAMLEAIGREAVNRIRPIPQATDEPRRRNLATRIGG